MVSIGSRLWFHYLNMGLYSIAVVIITCFTVYEFYYAVTVRYPRINQKNVSHKRTKMLLLLSTLLVCICVDIQMILSVVRRVISTISPSKNICPYYILEIMKIFSVHFFGHENSFSNSSTTKIFMTISILQAHQYWFLFLARVSVNFIIIGFFEHKFNTTFLIWIK